MTPEAGHVIASKYRLDRALASGGMGSIWVARHLDLDVDVAVKLMSEELAQSEAGRRRFQREARSAAQLRSPHVTQILDYGVDEGRPYIIMELLVGEDLDQHLEALRTLPPARALQIVEPVCRGLKIAHGMGIVHRDLKPSNIFLSVSGDQEVVKILDFGIAKVTHPDQAVGDGTATGVLVGTPRYMSPEQAQGLGLDHRSDLWSLGVVLYEVLTGTLPFEGDNLGQIITALCLKSPAPPRSLVPALPAAMDDFFVRALAPAPEERFCSADELLEALRAVVDGKPLPPPWFADEPTEQEAPGGSVSVTVQARPPGQATVDSDASLPQVDTVEVPGAERVAMARTQLDGGTSPGVGLDSGERDRPGRRRRVVAWAVAGAVGATLAGAWLLRGDGADVARGPGSATATPVSQPPAPVTVEAVRPAAPAPEATASVGPSASAAPPPPPPPPPPPASPRSSAAPPVRPPPPAPNPDPTFGL